jgi:hypothetical protein
MVYCRVKRSVGEGEDNPISDPFTCPECGVTFDRADLDAVMFHGFGHVPRPDMPYSKAERVDKPQIKRVKKAKPE